jgi:hypothetical protein
MREQVAKGHQIHDVFDVAGDLDAQFRGKLLQACHGGAGENSKARARAARRGQEQCGEGRECVRFCREVNLEQNIPTSSSSRSHGQSTHLQCVGSALVKAKEIDKQRNLQGVPHKRRERRAITRTVK